MRINLLAGAALVLAIAIGGPCHRAAAMVPASPSRTITGSRDDGVLLHVHLRRANSWQWAPRQYWRWDHRPIWDDPWEVLRPTIWGSPEPYLVPADIWACEWHLPRVHPRYRHRHRCHAWH